MEKNLEENAPESPNESSTQLFRKEKSSRIFTWANLDIFINNLNHGLIAITTFYLTWLCVKAGITHHFSMHTIIATIGYQVLMAQGIMVFWKRNTYTILVDNRDKKATLHWVLLGLGTILGVLGTFWEYVWREQNNRRHFVNRHGVWGKVAWVRKCWTQENLKDYFRLIFNVFVNPDCSLWTIGAVSTTT